MSSSPFPRVFVIVVMAMAIILSALAVMHKTPDPLPGSTSEILTPVWPGEVLS